MAACSQKLKLTKDELSIARLHGAPAPGWDGLRMASLLGRFGTKMGVLGISDRNAKVVIMM